MRILWTKHAEERQKEWAKKLDLTREEVEGTRKILTVYWTSRANKYWKEEADEDSV